MAYPKFFFDNRFSDAAPVASSTYAGNYNAVNLNDMRQYTWWKPAVLPATVTVNSGSVQTANYAIIYGHDLFTQSARIEIHGSTDNFVTSDVVLASLTPASNSPVFLEFASASYRYWQLKVMGSTMPSIAIAMIGNEFVMPSYLKAAFDPITRQVIQQETSVGSTGSANISDNGAPLGKIIDFEQWAQTLQFGFINLDWLRNTWQPAWRSYLRGNPFLFAWNTDLYPAELYLVWGGDNYTAPHQPGGSWADLSIDVSGVAT